MGNACGNIALRGEDVGQALKTGVLEGAVNSVAGYAAGRVGEAFPTGGPIHKIAHGAVGAGLGAGLNAIAGEDVFMGATSGAIGAIAAETIAEILSGGPGGFMTQVQERAKAAGRRLTQQEVQDLLLEETRTNANWSKIGSTIVTFLSGQDVNVGAAAANNAIDNNFLVFSYYGEVGMGLAWIAYDFGETLESDGLHPALAKLGIEVSMEAEGKYSFEGRPYETLKETLNVVFERHPVLKVLLGPNIERMLAIENVHHMIAETIGNNKFAEALIQDPKVNDMIQIQANVQYLERKFGSLENGLNSTEGAKLVDSLRTKTGLGGEQDSSEKVIFTTHRAKVWIKSILKNFGDDLVRTYGNTGPLGLAARCVQNRTQSISEVYESFSRSNDFEIYGDGRSNDSILNGIVKRRDEDSDPSHKDFYNEAINERIYHLCQAKGVEDGFKIVASYFLGAVSKPSKESKVLGAYKRTNKLLNGNYLEVDRTKDLQSQTKNAMEDAKKDKGKEKEGK
jgi:hypothetical protein